MWWVLHSQTEQEWLRALSKTGCPPLAHDRRDPCSVCGRNAALASELGGLSFIQVVLESCGSDKRGLLAPLSRTKCC